MYTRFDSSWTSEDTKRAILASLVPGAVGLTSFMPFYVDKNIVEWWSSSKKPSWAPKNLLCYAGMDVLTLAPIGCASYLVYKHGGGFENKITAITLGLYGTNLALCVAVVPFMKKRNLNFTHYFCVAIHLTALGASAAAYKVCHCASLLMAPYALWTGFYAVLTYAMKNLNSDEVKVA